MATRVPRIAVTLKPETRDLVQRLAELNELAGAGRYSAAGVIAELIEAQAPMLRQLVELGEQARTLTDEQRARVAGVVDSLETDVLGAADGAMAQWNDAVGKIKGAL